MALQSRLGAIRIVCGVQKYHLVRPLILPPTSVRCCSSLHSSCAANSSVGGSSGWGSGSRSGRRSSATSVCAVRTSSSSGGSDDDEEDRDDTGLAEPSTGGSAATAGAKPLRVERLLANLGYGKRKECAIMIKRRQLVYAATGQPAKVGEKALASQLLLQGEALDPGPPLTLLLHKPVGYVVTSPDDEMVTDLKVYDLLPYRFGRRRPFLSAVGRLDKETSGLLILTDDGQLLHSIQSPARGIWKRYTATLAAPLSEKEAATAAQRFASGQLQLQGDRTPLLPAAVRMLGPTTADVAICEGRYHQIRRMFGALGHTVVALHRYAIGGLSLAAHEAPELAEGSWRYAAPADIAAVMAGPESLEAAAAEQQQQGGAAQRPPAAAGGGAGVGSGMWEQQQQQQQQQQQGAVQLPSTSAAGSQRDGSSSNNSSSSQSSRPPGRGNGAATATIEGAEAEEPQELDDDDDDVDHPGEAAAATKRYRDSSKWARRRAALSQAARRLARQQEQQLEQQQQEQQQQQERSSQPQTH